ncbi:response regulator receiver protein [Candidatus Magnetoovum chiemensis]|nr:response regulator receiver protein [Candidatus Magnetoovum chiemensis]
MANNKTFLVADDEPVSVRMLQRYLSRFGQCDIATDGHKAVEAFIESNKNGRHYDLIFMDILMPTMNGFEALSAIREKETVMRVKSKDAVKIIIMTGLGLSRETFNLHRTTCLDYLFKPFDVKIFTYYLQKT